MIGNNIQLEDTNYPNMKRLSNSTDKFFAQFYPSPDNTRMRNGNKWRLEIASYHKSTELRPLKIKRENQRPRWKTIGYYNTIEECAKVVKEY